MPTYPESPSPSGTVQTGSFRGYSIFPLTIYFGFATPGPTQ